MSDHDWEYSETKPSAKKFIPLMSAGLLASLSTPPLYVPKERNEGKRSSLSASEQRKRKKKNKQAKKARKRNRK